MSDITRVIFENVFYNAIKPKLIKISEDTYINPRQVSCVYKTIENKVYIELSGDREKTFYLADYSLEETIELLTD